MLVWRVGQQFLSSRNIKILPRWFDGFAAALGTVLLYAFGAAAFFRVIPGRDNFQLTPYLFVVGLLVGVGVVLVSRTTPVMTRRLCIRTQVVRRGVAAAHPLKLLPAP